MKIKIFYSPKTNLSILFISKFYSLLTYFWWFTKLSYIWLWLNWIKVNLVLTFIILDFIFPFCRFKRRGIFLDFWLICFIHNEERYFLWNMSFAKPFDLNLSFLLYLFHLLINKLLQLTVLLLQNFFRWFINIYFFIIIILFFFLKNINILFLLEFWEN